MLIASEAVLLRCSSHSWMAVRNMAACSGSIPLRAGRPPQLPVGLCEGAVVVGEHHYDVRVGVRRRPVARRAPGQPFSPVHTARRRS
ncbi:hypothetical protein ACE1SV_73730 [Streptomyces sp. E-15]